MPAELKICMWSPSRFRDNSCFFFKQTKGILNDFLQCLLYRNVADDVLLQKHFTDLDYLDRFSRCELFYEPQYL